jgi:peptide/nickel transport system ATP-binding protein
LSFDLEAGKTLSLVGESGSGKTTIGRAILGLAPVCGGSITFRGETISNVSRGQRRKLASDVQVVFQDPYSSLNPAMTVESILVEPLAAAGVTGGPSGCRPTPGVVIRGSSPEANDSASPLPGRSRSTLPSSSATSRRARST